jgi:hypothetical protein
VEVTRIEMNLILDILCVMIVMEEVINNLRELKEVGSPVMTAM